MTFISGFLSGSSLAVPIKTFGENTRYCTYNAYSNNKGFPCAHVQISFIYKTDHGKKVTQNNIKWVSNTRKGMKVFKLLSIYKQTCKKNGAIFWYF